MEKEILLPKLGESIVSATVVQWFKKEGDAVALDEPLLEVSTDKVNSEIPAPFAGTIKKILAQPDQEVEVGHPLALLEATSGDQPPASKKETRAAKEKAAEETTGSMRDFFSPAVLRLAREMGISLDELEKIPRTGSGGRLTKRDLEEYAVSKPAPKEEKKPARSEEERMKMTGMRKAIAENMVKSFYEAPHASLVTEVDVTRVMQLIKANKESFLKKHGYKITITSFIAKAIAQAIKEFPLINASLEEDTIILKRCVNLGIAVNVEQGLMVPVIRNCQGKSVTEIAKDVADLSQKARTNKLAPDDVTEGSITLTNFGMAGTLIGIPIIRYPEVGIIGVGAIKKRVIALEDDTMAIRSMMHVSLTFDHRVLDGIYGCGFLNALKTHLEEDLAL